MEDKVENPGSMENYRLSIDVIYPCYFWSPINMGNWKQNEQKFEKKKTQKLDGNEK